MARDEYEKIFRPKLREVIAWVHDGLTDAQVGKKTGLTEHTVKNYMRIVFDRLGLWNRVELAIWYEVHILGVKP